jgi:hypothetical protein
VTPHLESKMSVCAGMKPATTAKQVPSGDQALSWTGPSLSGTRQSATPLSACEGASDWYYLRIRHDELSVTISDQCGPVGSRHAGAASCAAANCSG